MNRIEAIEKALTEECYRCAGKGRLKRLRNTHNMNTILLQPDNQWTPKRMLIAGFKQMRDVDCYECSGTGTKRYE